MPCEFFAGLLQVLLGELPGIAVFGLGQLHRFRVVANGLALDPNDRFAAPRAWLDALDAVYTEMQYRARRREEGPRRPLTRVIDVGILCASWQVEPIQAQLAEHTTVCTFDRAGYFHSDSGPKPRSTSRIVEETRKMLRIAKLDPPYVLVGTSMGGEHMRYFASKYPNEVGGLVLVESGNATVA